MFSRRVSSGFVVVALFVAFLVVGIRLWSEGRAEVFPGSVAQGAEARSDGATVKVTRAVFSGTAADLWLDVQFDDAAAQPAGIAPSDADLAGVSARSAAVAEGGGVMLRFPALVSAEPVSVATLRIAAVQLLGAQGIERVSGTWVLEVKVPRGDAARAAARVDALEPVVVEIAGQQVTLAAYRTSAATVLHYELPPGLLEGRPPMLRVGKEELAARRMESDGRAREAWFDATPDNGPLTVVLDGLASASGGEATVQLAIEPFVPPAATGAGEETVELALTWKVETPGGPAVREVTWHRDLSGTTILVLVDGIWDPEIGGKPAVFADGASLFVRGAGYYLASGERGDRSMVEADLPGGQVPRNLIVVLAGAASPIPPVEVVLRP